jgi:hypothetical protein
MPKTRLNLTITPAVRARLEDLQEASGAESMTEVIRRSLALYELAWDLDKKGGHVIFKHADGSEERLALL